MTAESMLSKHLVLRFTLVLFFVPNSFFADVVLQKETAIYKNLMEFHPHEIDYFTYPHNADEFIEYSLPILRSL